MTDGQGSNQSSTSLSGLHGLTGIAAYFRIPAEPQHLARELALGEREATADDILRAASLIGLKARIVRDTSIKRLSALPVPSLAQTKEGSFIVLGGLTPGGLFRTVDPVTRADIERPVEEVAETLEPLAILVQRRVGGPGIHPANFNFTWFLPSIWRYRRALSHVLVASLALQIFALVTPMFFQVVIDKVLVHRSASTLDVIVIGLVGISCFDVLLQFLRSYALTHTTNRIDVELGQRLFAHLLRLPVSYFETRPAGQTVARVRELETIRSFITGQGLFAALDLVFTVVMVAVLFVYSVKLALIVMATVPLYIFIAAIIAPALRERVKEKFNRGAYSQQFLVETIIGAQTIKASAVEPVMRAEWEERLAAYVRTGFEAALMAFGGQDAIQLVSKFSTALLLFFGAVAVMDGELTVGSLVAFNMISGQVAQPILRLSQLWQDFQQVAISVARLGDILNATPEPANAAMAALPPPRGAIEFRNVSFRYMTGAQDVLKNINLAIEPGEIVGVVGPSGSGKSTLTKLVQRFYSPQEGQIRIDGLDLTQVDPAWLRRHIGVVLQENLLFAKTIHENIALANPAMPRARVIAVAELAGAHEFIAKLPMGYDTPIEERGSNLSGGQRQRLAIARALATNPRILILDEATSALDYESEVIIQQNMARIVRGRTVIIIAHRLSTVRNANRIVGMVDGRIVEMGSHDELISREKGLYKRLWSIQSSGIAA